MIRFVRQEDLNDLVKLCAEHAAFERCDYDPKGKLEKLKLSLFSSNPKLYCLVAEETDGLVGFATYMLQYSTWDACDYVYMDCIYLAEKARRQGLGNKLMQRIQRETNKHKCNLIQWQTPNFNESAITFYKKIGAVSKAKERFFLSV